MKNNTINPEYMQPCPDGAILEAETNANQRRPTHKCVKPIHKCVEREDKRTDATADKSSQLTGRTTDDWY